MLKIALTGGIACGKSLVGSIMEELGAVVIEADVLAHDVMRPGMTAFEEIVAAFGAAILSPSGVIDRRALGELVFGDARKMALLNAAVHPRVRAAWEARLAAFACAGRVGPVVVVVPLLFEAGMERGWDAIVCVVTEPGEQMARLRRRGFSEVEARRRIAAQLPMEEKARRSDAVLENTGTIEVLRAHTQRLMVELVENKHGRTTR